MYLVEFTIVLYGAETNDTKKLLSTRKLHPKTISFFRSKLMRSLSRNNDNIYDVLVLRLNE